MLTEAETIDTSINAIRELTNKYGAMVKLIICVIFTVQGGVSSLFLCTVHVVYVVHNTYIYKLAQIAFFLMMLILFILPFLENSVHFFLNFC